MYERLIPLWSRSQPQKTTTLHPLFFTKRHTNSQKFNLYELFVKSDPIDKFLNLTNLFVNESFTNLFVVFINLICKTAVLREIVWLKVIRVLRRVIPARVT